MLDVADINTGNEALDESLRRFYDFARSNSAKLIVDAAKEGPEKLAPVLDHAIESPELARIVLILLDEDLYGAQSEQIAETKRSLLESARNIALSIFPWPESATLLVKKMRSLGLQKKNSNKLDLKTVSGIGWSSYLLSRKVQQGKSALVPTVRLGLRDEEERLLLDTHLDWDDLLFLLASLARLTKREFEDFEYLIPMNVLDLGVLDPKKLAKRLSQLRVDVEAIVSLARKYGIDVDNLNMKDSDNVSPS